MTLLGLPTTPRSKLLTNMYGETQPPAGSALPRYTFQAPPPSGIRFQAQGALTPRLSAPPLGLPTRLATRQVNHPIYEHTHPTACFTRRTARCRALSARILATRGVRLAGALHLGCGTGCVPPVGPCSVAGISFLGSCHAAFSVYERHVAAFLPWQATRTGHEPGANLW